ncbi:MAG: mechanosensitive ion channel family protein [Xanthomonadaceae bacterium]|nr:mechanosensitive ion channel family protein [Xanthomonadaceae bacterium]
MTLRTLVLWAFLCCTPIWTQVAFGAERSAPGETLPAAARPASAPATESTVESANAPASRDSAEARCAANHIADCFEAIYGTARQAGLNLLRKIPLLILAMLVMLIAQWVSRFVANRLHLLNIRSDNPYMSGLVKTVVRSAILLIGVLIALDLLGMTSVVGAVLGSAGVVGLVLGFAFRDIAENYIAGILLSVRRSFEPGDTVSIDGREGKVISVNSRATVLMTFDGNQLQIPNSLVFKSVILNYSRNPKRRFEFTTTIDVSQSIRRSGAAGLAAIATIDGVLDDPAPSWLVVENGNAGIVLKFYGWIDQRESDLGKTRSEAIRQTKTAFAREGIEAPRTIYHIARLHDDALVVAEPEHNGVTDTSVNREIDEQVASARAEATGQNLLQPNKTAK